MPFDGQLVTIADDEYDARQNTPPMGLCGSTDVNDVPSTLVTRDSIPTMEA